MSRTSGGRLTETCDVCGGDVPIDLYADHLVEHASALTSQLSEPQGSKAGMTKLHRVAYSGRVSAVLDEIASGADVGGAVDRDGWTALFYAAHSDEIDVAAALLDAGVPPSHQANDGTQAWQYGRDEISSYLGEVLEFPFPELLERGFTYRQLAEPYEQFRAARLAGQPIPEAKRLDHLLAVLAEARDSDRASLDRGGHRSSRDGQERKLGQWSVFDGGVIISSEALYYGSVDATAWFFGDKRFESVPWRDVGSIGYRTTSHPLGIGILPWTKAHKVVVMSRSGREMMEIWCKSNEQADEIMRMARQLL